MGWCDVVLYIVYCSTYIHILLIISMYIIYIYIHIDICKQVFESCRWTVMELTTYVYICIYTLDVCKPMIQSIRLYITYKVIMIYYDDDQ